MVQYLDDYGYHPNYTITRYNVPGCGNYHFGNVIFATGPLRSWNYYHFARQDGTPERRGVVCSLNGSLLGDWQACSAHLDNPETVDITYVQANELYNVAALGGDTFQIIGGDFNINSRYTNPAVLNQWRAKYDEIDEMLPRADTHDDGRKLDYIWASAGPVTSPYTPGITRISDGDPPADHHYYSGRFRVG